jgi:hypothetical protein
MIFVVLAASAASAAHLEVRSLDCPVTFFREETPDGPRVKQGDAHYVFTFQTPPQKGLRAELLFSVTLWNGRSWHDSGQVLQRAGNDWPHFSARASHSGSTATFESDLSKKGVVKYSSIGILPDGAGADIIEGECTFVSHQTERG